MKVVGLFAGIGGFELGFAAAGHRTTLLCEILPHAQAVLRTRFPDVEIEPDILRLERLPADTEVVCAGFPCQDLSQAGQTRGLGGDQSGLIFEVFRLLRAADVPFLVLENVPFMLQLHGGAAMREIIRQLEALGYRWAYRVVDTFSFGLPQRRERVFLVASRIADPASILLADDRHMPRPATSIGEIAHGFYWTEGLGGLGWAPDGVPTLKNGSTIGIPSPPAILMPDGTIGKPDIRDAERLQGFAVNWTKPAEAVGRASLRWGLVGSAVSVPVAKWLGQRLQQPRLYHASSESPFPVAGKIPRAARFDGRERIEVAIGTDPVAKAPPHLAGFLRYPLTPLSAKATAGFLARARRAKLRFAEGFLDLVERHLAVAEKAERRAPSRSEREREPAAVLAAD